MKQAPDAEKCISRTVFCFFVGGDHVIGLQHQPSQSPNQPSQPHALGLPSKPVFAFLSCKIYGNSPSPSYYSYHSSTHVGKPREPRTSAANSVWFSLGMLFFCLGMFMSDQRWRSCCLRIVGSQTQHESLLLFSLRLSDNKCAVRVRNHCAAQAVILLGT